MFDKVREEYVSPENDEVCPDAIQLLCVANFNGVCRIIAALAENGLIGPEQLDGIHDAMTTPLDDTTFRDDEFVTFTRTTLESVLADALRNVKEAGL